MRGKKEREENVGNEDIFSYKFAWGDWEHLIKTSFVISVLVERKGREDKR